MDNHEHKGDTRLFDKETKSKDLTEETDSRPASKPYIPHVHEEAQDVALNTEGESVQDEEQPPLNLSDMVQCDVVGTDRSESSKIMKFMENFKENVMFKNPLGKVSSGIFEYINMSNR